ncbi:MAG: glutaredoxin domain-containing protein [archaeon]
MKAKVYSTPTCPFCVMVKDWLKEKNIEFEDINVAENQDAAKYMIEKTNQRGVPVIEIGDEFVVGFNKPKLAELLKVEP